MFPTLSSNSSEFIFQGVSDRVSNATTTDALTWLCVVTERMFVEMVPATIIADVRLTKHTSTLF